MFKTAVPTEKAEQTRREIFDTALLVFREKGFDASSMREIAARAGVALGAAYYYFPSKEAIIQAYYGVVQSEHERLVLATFFDPRLTLKQRLQFAIQSKLDILQHDRKLLGVIFRYSGEPDHPLSCLGPGTEPARHASMAIFSRAVENEKLPDDLRELLIIAMWALHMGVLILFLYDNSPRQRRTRRLVDGAVELAAGFLSVARSPLLKPWRRRVLALLRDADLLSDLETLEKGGNHGG